MLKYVLDYLFMMGEKKYSCQNLSIFRWRTVDINFSLKCVLSQSNHVCVHEKQPLLMPCSCELQSVRNFFSSVGSNKDNLCVFSMFLFSLIYTSITCYSVQICREKFLVRSLLIQKPGKSLIKTATLR